MMDYRKLFVLAVAAIALTFAAAAVSAEQGVDGVSEHTLDFKADYDPDTRMVTLIGTTDCDLLMMWIHDSTGKEVLPLSHVISKDGKIDEDVKFEKSGEKHPDGEYTVKLSYMDGFSKTAEFTVTPPVKITANMSGLDLEVGKSATVGFVLSGCTYDQVSVTANPSSVISVSGMDSNCRITVTAEQQDDAEVVLTVNGEIALRLPVHVSEKKANDVPLEFTFRLKMNMDWDIADYGSSNLTESNLRSGITIKGVGKNAGEALEDACNDRGIPNEFISTNDKNGNELRYWVVQIFGLGDEPLEDGDWKYWVQEYNGSYNQKTLGYFEDNSGVYTLTYKITSMEGMDVNPDVKPSDPSEKPLVDSETDKIKPTENEDGSTTSGTVTKGTTDDGSNVEVKKETTVNTDGSKKESTVETVKDVGGNQTTTTKEVSKDKDGNVTGITESTVEKTKEGSTETVSSTVVNEDSTQTVTAATVVKDKDGEVKEKTHTTTTVLKTDDGTVEEISDVTVTDRDGNVTEKKTVETSTDRDGNMTVKEVSKDSEGNLTGITESVVSKEKDTKGNTVTTTMTENKDRDSNTTSKTEVVETVSKDGRSSTVTETVKDAGDNVKGSKTTEKSTMVVGNFVTEKTETTVRGEGDSLKEKTSTVKTVENQMDDGKIVGTKTKEVTDTVIHGEDGKPSETKKTVTDVTVGDGKVEKKTVTEVKDKDGKPKEKTEEVGSSKVTKDRDGKVTKTVETNKVTSQSLASDGTVQETSVSERNMTDTKERTEETDVTTVKDKDDNLKESRTVTKVTTKDADGKPVETTEKLSAETFGADGKSEGKKENVKVSAADGRMSSSAQSKTGADGKTSTETVTTVLTGKDVGDDAIDAALKQSADAVSHLEDRAQEISKTLNLTTGKSTGLSISPSAVKKIADYGAGLKVDGGDGSIQIDGGVCDTLTSAGSGSIELSMQHNDRTVLSEKQKEAVGDNHFVDLNALVGGEKVHKLGGTATVTFQYELREGQLAANMAVYYIDDDGNRSLVDAVYKNGRFVLNTDHFSVFMVADSTVPAVEPDEGGDEQEKDNGGSSTMLVVGVVIVIAAVVAVVALMHSRKS